MSRGLLPVRRGRHNVIDDISGRKIASDKTRITWEGFVTSREDFDPKQPQLTLRSRSEDTSVRPTRTRPEQVFVTSVDPSSLNGKV